MSKSVRIDLLDGSCETSFETYGRLQVPWAKIDVTGFYIGRPKAELEHALDMLRDCDDEMTEVEYMESMFLYGLASQYAQPLKVVLVNVGGTLFHMRLAVAQRMPYFESLLRWREETETFLIDCSDTLVDRNPVRFQKVLTYVEVYGAAPQLLKLASKDATFYGVQHDTNLCFLCRKAPINNTENSGDTPVPVRRCPCGHKVCASCENDQQCSICLQSLVTCGAVEEEEEGAPEITYGSDYPKVSSSSNALLSLVAQGAQDNLLTQAPEITIHKTSHKQVTRSVFTYHTNSFTYTVGTWTLSIPRGSDMLGDSWIYLDFHACISDFPKGLWDICQIIGSMTVLIGGFPIETLTGPMLFALIRMGDAAAPVVEPLDDRHTRVVFPWMCFWWCVQGKKIPLVALQFHEVCLKLQPVDAWRATDCHLVSAAWYLDSAERRKIAVNPRSDIIVLHDSLTFSATGTVMNYVHHERLVFNHPTKDLILVVRPRCPVHAFHTGPVRLLELDFNGQTHMSIDGLFSRKILGEHLYHTEPKDDYLYFLPLDTLVKRKDYSSGGPIAHTTCNFSRIDSVVLKLTMLPGDYTIYLIARHINEIKYISGMAGLAFAH